MHIDVGGEGAHEAAINLNLATDGGLGPIPRLVLGMAQAMPMATRSIDLTTVENIPVHHAGIIEEVARTIRTSGEVRLVNPADFPQAMQAHEALAKMLGGTVDSVVTADGCRHTSIVLP
jgi:hypothetical protein